MLWCVYGALGLVGGLVRLKKHLEDLTIWRTLLYLEDITTHGGLTLVDALLDVLESMLR